MRPGQTGRKGLHWEFRWIGLIGAMILISACQSTIPLSSTTPSASKSRPARAQPAAPILSNDTASFIGLGDDDLSRTLGQPKLVRKDAPAEIWQYSGADCVVDFYLYADAKGLAVAYMEARDQAAESTPADRCVKSLLQSVSSENAQQKTL
jgi:hypothetical protein